MPRKPQIPHEELKEAIKAAGNVFDEKGNVLCPTAAIWGEISNALGGVLDPKYLYVIVKQNRHEVEDELRDHYGISAPRDESHNTKVPAPSPETTDESIASEDNDSTKECLVQPQKTFRVSLEPEVWVKIQPVQKLSQRKDRNGVRTMMVLPPGEWGDILIEKLWEQHKLPCPYTFKTSYVSTSLERQEYIRIRAHCRECGAEAVGRILAEPLENEKTELLWRANDTTDVPHKLKRQLRGAQRESVASAIQSASSAVFRRHRAKALMEQGDVEPPTLYGDDVLRKAKQQKRDNSLGIVKGTNPVINLEVMKDTEPYAGTIHDIGLNPFFVLYYSPSQRLIYQQHRKTSYVVVSIDATGSLVKKIDRLHGSSGHISLYEGVMRTDQVQLPIVQCLSEKHNANAVLYWLNEWTLQVRVMPQEVVIDNSAALKSAVARCFCRCKDVDDCKEKCFAFLTGKENSKPACYMRLDVAHFIASVKRWPCWKEPSLRRLADFYLRCLGLLIKSSTIESFREILKHVLTVALSPVEGKGADGTEVPMESSLRFLTKSIKGSPSCCDYDLDNPQSATDSDQEECPDALDNSSISMWLSTLENEVQRTILEDEDGRLNPYYSTVVARNFLRVCRDFPLWSAVMVDAYGSPHLTASSAPVEGSFNDLKTHILKGMSRPLRVDKFVAVHLHSIEGSCRIAGATPKKTKLTAGETRKIDLKSASHVEMVKVIRSDEETAVDPVVERNDTDIQSIHGVDIDEQDENSSSYVPLDLMAVDNWRGKALVITKDNKKKSKYLNDFPELDAAVHGERMRQPPKPLIRNGNNCPDVWMEKNQVVRVTNTCAFDATCQIFSAIYIDREDQREIMDTSPNTTIKTSRSLAIDGACKPTFLLRATALTAVVDPECALSMPVTTTRSTTRCSVSAIVYNCFGNASSLIKKLFASDPSAVVEVDCRSLSCSRDKVVRHVVVDANQSSLFEKGLAALDEAVLQGLRVRVDARGDLKTDCCKKVREGTEVKCRMNPHLFIDVEMLASERLKHTSIKSPFNRLHALHEIPVELSILSQKFILGGVIAYAPGHYLAYSRRRNGVWQLADDLRKDIISVSAQSSDVNPQVLIYVKA